jgi:hypothetical protein
VRQKRVSVCIEEENIQFYAAIMEASQMKKHRSSIFFRSFLQWLGPILQLVGSIHTIESTYRQLL